VRSLPYNPRLRERARELRNNRTLAEVLLWKHLKRGQLRGFDFHRQKPILEWIADFYCPELNLVIEIDGETHRFRSEADAAKESGFRSLGLTVLRFDDTETKQNTVGVVSMIADWIDLQVRLDGTSTHPGAFRHPSQEGIQAGPPFRSLANPSPLNP